MLQDDEVTSSSAHLYGKVKGESNYSYKCNFGGCRRMESTEVLILQHLVVHKLKIEKEVY